MTTLSEACDEFTRAVRRAANWANFAGNTTERKIEMAFRQITDAYQGVLRAGPQFGPMYRASLRRPPNYEVLPAEDQRAIDKHLGILDWDGDPSK